MNKKFLLAAMALPMLFTACSQDELFEGIDNGADIPKVKGYDVVLNPSLGGLDASRALWDDTYVRLTWEKTDLMSVYWLDDQKESETAALSGKFNSIFKTTDGNSFTSESLVFEGGNIAVFPGNTSFTKRGDIYLTVDDVQDASTIKKTPYISNYLEVSAVSVENPDQTEQIAGYNNGLYAPMKLAANVLYLNIELANTANLTQYGFKVESVELVAKSDADAKEKAFGKKATLVIDGTPYDKNKVHAKNAAGDVKADSVETIVKSVKTAVAEEDKTESLVSTAIEDKGNGKYLVKFVILPTDYEPKYGYSEIVINTNCGRINLTTEKKVGSKTAQKQHAYTAPEETETDVVWSGLVTGGVDAGGKAYTQSIDSLFQQVLASRAMEKGEESNFIGEKVGRPYARTIKADMANATLNNSPVYNSQDILNYIAIHTAMKSNEKMNLILSTKVENGDTFESLTLEAINAVDAKNTYAAAGVTENIKVTLSMAEGMDAVQIVGGGAVYFNNDKQWSSVDDNSLKMILEAGKNWTMYDHYSFVKVGSIVNNGTLTIAGTVSNNKQNTLNEKVVNNGTVKIGGNGTLQVGGNLNNVYVNTKDVQINGVVEVAASQNLVFNDDVTEGLAGTINVAQGGFMDIAKNINVTSNAVINNNGTVSSIAGNGGLINEGTINVQRNGAITYVQSNEDGVINLNSRNNEVVVNGNKGKIVYNYASATDGTTFKRVASDKFTYVVFNEDDTEITLAAADNTAGVLAINDISMEFAAETNLNSNDITVADVVVGQNAHLTFYSGNTLNVHCLTNNGNITIGGKIYYKKDLTDNGVVRSVGEGAIVYAPTYVGGDVKNLIAAIAAGEDVVLTADLDLTEDLEIPAGYNGTIDLNGMTISNKEDIYNDDPGDVWSLISVRGANTVVTIKGNGTVQARNNDCFAVDVRDGGKVIIEDGKFVGNITAVYVHTGSAEIRGGSYSIQQTCSVSGHDGYDETLNCKDENYRNGTASITVTGGSFYKFNPIQENSTEDSYLAEGYKSESKDGGDWYNVVKK